MTPDSSVSESQLSTSVDFGLVEDISEEISLIDLLTILAGRKWFILTITAFFATAAVIIALLLPKRFTASVSLMPPQQNSSIGGALASQLGSLGGVAALSGGSLGLKNPVDMYVAMIKSRTVEDAMIQRFGLMGEYHQKLLSDTRRAFEKHASIDGSGKDGLIRISVEDRDPIRAAELANGYLDQFRKLSEHLAITEASQRRLFFEQQLLQAKDNLADAEKALKQTETTTGVIQLDAQARALIESAASLHAQVAAKEVQIQSLHTFATGENSQLIQAQEELLALRAQLAKLDGNAEDSNSGMIMAKGKVPQAGLEYVRKLREVKYQETIFDILARQFELAKLDEAKQGAVIQVVDLAVPPDKRSFPKRGLIVIGSTAVGLMVGILIAFLQTGLQRMRNDTRKAEKLKNLRSALRFSISKGAAGNRFPQSGRV
jgi:tyrosine-protein kinase Etk/Wzc